MKYFIPLFLFLFAGCFSKRELPGSYFGNKGYTSVTLNSDSTFFYRYKFEFAYQYSEGAWKKEGKNMVLLQSYIKSRTLPLQVQEYDNNEKEGDENLLSVNINIPDNEKEYYQCSIFVNDALYKKKSCDSLSYIRISQPIKSIFFSINADERIPARFLDTLYTEKMIIQINKGNRLKVKIAYNDSLFNYRVFRGEVFKVSKKGLKFYSFQNNTWLYLPKK